MNHRTFRLPLAIAATAAIALLAGCGTTKMPEQAAATPVQTRAPVVAAAAPSPTAATPAGTAQSRVTSVDLAANRAAAAGAAALAALPSQRVVYFDYDSYVIKNDFQPLLDGYARVLGTSAKRLVIEGHADERGGREYNLALGQKRAAAVLNSLKLLGAKEGQMEAVSFGEERPAATGSDESAWAKNRRAELKDR